MTFLLKMPTNRNESINRIVHLFRIMQRLNRFVTEDMHSELSLVESILLYELDGDATRSVTELAAHLELDKATISRTLKNLAERKILRLGKDPADARRITIEIAAKGNKIIETNDSESNALLGWYLKFLTTEEQGLMAEYFRRFADSFGTPPSPLRKNDHPIRVELRRLAKALGYLKDSYMGTAFSPPEWQVMASIYVAPLPVSPAFLAYSLWTPASYMSRLLSGLVKKGLVRRPRSSEDSRVRDLYLTEKGTQAFHSIENSARVIFGEHLKGFSDTEVMQFAHIFALFIREPVDGVRLVERGAFVRVMQTEEDKATARGYLIRCAVDASLERSIPNNICADEQIAIGLFEESGLSGMMLLEPQKEETKLIAWFGGRALSPNTKTVWLEETPTLLTNHLRGYVTSRPIETSGHIGNI